MQEKGDKMNKILSSIIMGIMLISSLSVSASAEFSDVKKTDWFYSQVMTMTEKGLFVGKGNNLFCPNDTMTRAEFITVVVRALYPNADLTLERDQVWWQPIYEVATEKRIITESEFSINSIEQTITRQEMALISVRALYTLGETDIEDYTDIPDINTVGTYYRDYVCKAYGAGIIVGDNNGNFNPQNTLTRAEATTVLYRIVNKSVREKVDFSTGAIEENKQYTSNGLPSINPNNGFAVPEELVNSSSTAPITIYEGQVRSNRPAKAGDTFVKKDGTQIILQKDQYGIVGGGQGVAPDIGLFYNGNTCSKNENMTYDGLSGALLWTDSTGANINNASYSINATTGSGHWSAEWQLLSSKIAKPSYKGSSDGEISKDAYHLYKWDSIMEMWVYNR